MAGRGYVGATVVVSGLDQLVRDFGKVSKELRRDLQRELQDVAKIVSDEAKAIVERDTLIESGKLKNGIRPRVRGATAIVENRAQKGGFKYPGIYEFGVSGRVKARRPFLLPALEAKQGEVYEALEDMLDRLTSKNGLGRGGTL
jgi:hypothetical protein